MMGLRSAYATALLLCSAPLAAGAQVVGHVASLDGVAVAERPGQEPRTLACRDAVHAGERIVTADGAKVGVLVGDVLTRIGENTSVALDAGADVLANLTLEVGEIRVLDPREGATGAPVELAALDARARVAGNDAEAYIFAEKTGEYAMLCEWDTPLAVSRADEKAVAGPGSCVIAKGNESLYEAEAHDVRMVTPEDETCDFGTPYLAANLLTPVDVAAGLVAVGPVLPSGPSAPLRSPCDTPGSRCQGADPFVIVEPPPGGGPFPGGNTFPGTN